MRILVVEDERLLCDGIAEDLELEKYTVDRCYDGADAHERLFVEPYDLVILDLNLPGMDGLELLRRIRSEQPELRVLILSARAQLSDKGAGLDLGAHPAAPGVRPAGTPGAGGTAGPGHRGRGDLRPRGSPFPDAPRVCHPGAADALPGAVAQRGGTDGARLGSRCQPLQQRCGDAHLHLAEKAAGAAGL